MTFIVDSISVPVKTGNNWIDSLLPTSENLDSPGLYLQALTISRDYVTYTFDSVPVVEWVKQDAENADNSFRCSTTSKN